MENHLLYPSVERVMEVTNFKSGKLAQAAIDTLKWLDNGAPSIKLDSRPQDDAIHFSMKSFIDQEEYSCGTVCCIAGSIALRADEYKNKTVLELSNSRMQDIFPNYFADGKLHELFYPRTIKDGILCAGIAFKTPKESADTLLRYLFTGVVYWSETDADE